MSMIGRFRRVTGAQLEQWWREPGEFRAWFSGLPPELGEAAGGLIEARVAEFQKKFMAEIARGRVVPSEELEREVQRMRDDPAFRRAVGEVMGAARGARIPDDPEQVSLEKSWHVLHCAITGRVEPDPADRTESPILGGREIPDDAGAMGYGPARGITPEEVARFARELTGLDWDARLAARDTRAAVARGVYAADHDLAELRHYAALLTRFYECAARRGDAVLAWID